MHISKTIAAFILFFALITPAHAATLLRDEETEQYLKIMTRPIFDQAGLSADNVRFVIVNDSEMNAFVAGGQNIFLNTGLILQTETPAELLGVIAHETGHISGGHLFRTREEMSNLSLQALLTNLLGIVIAVGGRNADAGIAVGNAGSSFALRNMLRHSRTQEGTADQSGVRFLEGAGLPTSGFLSFMKKLGSQELLPESQQTQYVLTHPLTQDRIDTLQHVVDRGAPGKIPPEWDEYHKRIKAKLTGYVFPDKALQDKSTTTATLYGQAVARFRKGQIDKALALIEPLIKQEPDNPYFYELKGEILFENGAIAESIPMYQRAVERLPSSGLLRMSYAYSLIESKTKDPEKSKEQLNEAIKQLNIAVAREKRMAQPHHLLGIAYGKLGQEGLSRLHLAEEALMQNRLGFAAREASLAKTQLKKTTPAWRRANDILVAATKNRKETQEKD